MSKIKVGIVGGAGYTGGELLRILIYHAEVDIVFVNSKSNAGNPIWKVHSDIFGDSDLIFTDELNPQIDVLFLCLGHGDSKKFLLSHSSFFANHTFKIIDLSQDFRLKANAKLSLENKVFDFVYGLPELNKEKIKNAQYIANPGCFATCIQLGLLPLAANKMLKNEVNLTALTGSTGAGQQATETTHFSWRSNNLSVYKAFTHQHLGEISESLVQASDNKIPAINFIPYRGDFTRGIIANSVLQTEASFEEVIAIFQKYYAQSPFVFVSKENIHLKQVINTNKCIIYLEKHEDKLLIVSEIDNLLKGASGQAVQNMNLMFGLAEKTGLNLKSIGF